MEPNLPHADNRRVALVTGATGWIGSAIAERLVADGMAVALTGRRSDRLAELRGRLATLGGEGAVVMVAADLTEPRQVQAAVDEVTATLRSIDVLVNNAGAWSGSVIGPFSEKTFDQLRAEVDDNLMSAVYACRAVMPGMAERGFGRVINVSSVAGIVALEGHGAYSAAKLGMTGLARQLGVEYARLGVTVNCVAPGAVATPLTRERLASAEPPARLTALVEATPSGRLTTPEEVAAAVSFLASDAAAQINGQTIALDGGLTVA